MRLIQLVRRDLETMAMTLDSYIEVVDQEYSNHWQRVRPSNRTTTVL
jgi:hypothetical protein